MTNPNPMVCPICHEGVLDPIECGKCGLDLYFCDECESLFRTPASWESQGDSEMCPHCGETLVYLEM